MEHSLNCYQYIICFLYIDPNNSVYALYNIYGPIIQILMCVFYFNRTESDVFTNRIQIFVSWTVVKQSKEKQKKQKNKTKREKTDPFVWKAHCRRPSMHPICCSTEKWCSTLSLNRWYTLSYCVSCSANCSGKKNNCERQVAYAESESIHIHQSQEDRVGLIQHCLTNK